MFSAIVSWIVTKKEQVSYFPVPSKSPGSLRES